MGPQLRRGQGAPKRSVWTRPKMQALFWIVRRKVVRRSRVSGLSIAACHSPRARMEMRGSGPNRLHELESSPFEYRFSRSRLDDRLPLHCPPTCSHSSGRYPRACPLRRPAPVPGRLPCSSSAPRRCAPSYWPAPLQPAYAACAPASGPAMSPAARLTGPPSPPPSSRL